MMVKSVININLYSLFNVVLGGDVFTSSFDVMKFTVFYRMN